MSAAEQGAKEAASRAAEQAARAKEGAKHAVEDAEYAEAAAREAVRSAAERTREVHKEASQTAQGESSLSIICKPKEGLARIVYAVERDPLPAKRCRKFRSHVWLAFPFLLHGSKLRWYNSMIAHPTLLKMALRSAHKRHERQDQDAL